AWRATDRAIAGPGAGCAQCGGHRPARDVGGPRGSAAAATRPAGELIACACDFAGICRWAGVSRKGTLPHLPRMVRGAQGVPSVRINKQVKPYLAALAMAVSSIAAQAEPIEFVFSGTADFELGEQFIEGARFSLRATADTESLGKLDHFGLPVFEYANLSGT